VPACCRPNGKPHPASSSSCWASCGPDLILHFGVSARARGFEIERRGQNRCFAHPDAVGALPSSLEVRAGGPDVLAASLPVSYIVVRLRSRRIPAFASRDAGGYLCNATLYNSLAAARAHPGPPRRLYPRSGQPGTRGRRERAPRR
jgi:pyroglutamyl-peptidase